MGRVIIFREKYGERYFDASDNQKLARACAVILKQRVEEGYWYHREYDGEFPLNSEEQKLAAFTDAQVEALPEPFLSETKKKRAAIQKRRAVWEREKKNEDAWFTALEKVISVAPEDAHQFTTDDAEGFKQRNPAPLALAVIDYRADGEYEGYDLENLE